MRGMAAPLVQRDIALGLWFRICAATQRAKGGNISGGEGHSITMGLGQTDHHHS